MLELSADNGKLSGREKKSNDHISLSSTLWLCFHRSFYHFFTLFFYYFRLFVRFRLFSRQFFFHTICGFSSTCVWADSTLSLNGGARIRCCCCVCLSSMAVLMSLSHLRCYNFRIFSTAERFFCCCWIDLSEKTVWNFWSVLMLFIQRILINTMNASNSYKTLSYKIFTYIPRGSWSTTRFSVNKKKFKKEKLIKLNLVRIKIDYWCFTSCCAIDN